MMNTACLLLVVVYGGLSDFTDALKQGVKEVGKEVLQDNSAGNPPATGETTINNVVNVLDAGKKMVDNRLGPVEEFYLGRKVSAQVLGAYPKRLPQDSPVTQYVTKVGTTLAMASRAPYPYRPYVFVVLDTAEVNAFAAPGGIIFVTTGMLRFLENEDALAGVLGHEMGHEELRHGVRTLEQEGAIKFAGATANAAAQEAAGSGEVDTEIVSQFTGAVVDQVAKGVRNGYSVKLEAEADERAMEICYLAGYDPKALVDVLKRFESGSNSYGGAQYPKDRQGSAAAVLSRMPGSEGMTPLPARTERYQTNKTLLTSPL